MHTSFFHTLIPQPSERQMKNWAEKKNTEKGKEISFVHTGQRFSCIKPDPLQGTRWLRQGHCVLWSSLQSYLSWLTSQKALINQVFYEETNNGIFQSVKSQTQEIQS